MTDLMESVGFAVKREKNNLQFHAQHVRTVSSIKKLRLEVGAQLYSCSCSYKNPCLCAAS
jgi:hypothetical protein